MPKRSDTVISEMIKTKVPVSVVALVTAAVVFGLAGSAFLLLNMKTSIKTGNSPLSVVDVVRAVSVRDPLETIPFLPQRYYAGSAFVYEQPTQGSSADTAYRVAGRNDPLAIHLNDAAVNTNASTGFTSQYILIWYRQVGDVQDRLMTVCLGQTSALSVYVGSDGSTYTDSLLRNRTTVRTCGQLKQMNQGVGQVSQGSASIVATNHGQHNVVRSIRVLARFDDGVLQPNEPDTTSDPVVMAQIIANFRTPVWVGFAPATDGQGNFTSIVPPAIFRLVDIQSVPGQTTVQYLCHPGAVYNEATTGPAIFFDRDGNAYRDMWLTDRVMTADCATTVSRMFQLSELTDLNGIAGISESFNLGPFRLYQDQNWLYTIYADGTGPFQNYAYNPAGPMSIVASPDIAQAVMAVPQTLFHIEGKVHRVPGDPGQNAVMNFCTPAYTYNAVTGEGRTTFYFDVLGNPYLDIFLTQRAMTTDCAGSFNRGLHFTTLNNAAVTSGQPGSFAGTLNFQFSRSTNFGQLVFPAGNYSMDSVTEDIVIPLRVLVVAEPTDASQVTVPLLQLGLTGSFTTDSTLQAIPVSATICLPSFPLPITQNANFRNIYYSQDGQPYNDLLLLDPISCTGSSGGGGGLEPIETQ